MPRSRIVLLAKLMEMLGEVAFLSSVNGMTTYKLALSVHRVLSWRHSASGRGAGAGAGAGGRTSSGGIVLSKYNDNASIVALVSYLISDGGKMFVYDPELEAQQTAERRRVLSAPSLKSASSAIVLGGGGAPSPRAGYALSAAGSASAKSPKRGSIARMDHVSRVRQVPGR